MTAYVPDGTPHGPGRPAQAMTSSKRATLLALLRGSPKSQPRDEPCPPGLPGNTGRGVQHASGPARPPSRHVQMWGRGTCLSDEFLMPNAAGASEGTALLSIEAQTNEPRPPPGFWRQGMMRSSAVSLHSLGAKAPQLGHGRGQRYVGVPQLARVRLKVRARKRSFACRMRGAPASRPSGRPHTQCLARLPPSCWIRGNGQGPRPERSFSRGC
jgi:hypothetical protein